MLSLGRRENGEKRNGGERRFLGGKNCSKEEKCDEFIGFSN